jgi:hypothetical protein
MPWLKCLATLNARNVLPMEDNVVFASDATAICPGCQGHLWRSSPRIGSYLCHCNTRRSGNGNPFIRGRPTAEPSSRFSKMSGLTEEMEVSMADQMEGLNKQSNLMPK